MTSCEPCSAFRWARWPWCSSVLVGVGVAVVAALALRNIVFFRLGVRNIGRRAGRTVLIVVGLMLATTIIAAALGTGDAIGGAVRSGVLKTLGNSDEWITVKGAKPGLVGAEDSAGMQLFDQRAVAAVDRAVRGSRPHRRRDAGDHPQRRGARQDLAADRAARHAVRAGCDPARRVSARSREATDAPRNSASLAPGSVF